MAERDDPPRPLAARPEALRRGPLSPPSRQPAVGAAADLRAAGVPQPPRRTPGSSTAKPSTSSPNGDGEPVGRITAQVDERWDEFQGERRRDVRLLRVRGLPPDAGGKLVDAATEWAARPRSHAHARPDGLHHQRRGRHPDRGLRAAADDPRALAPALLQGPARGARLRQGDGPADVGAGARQPQTGREVRPGDPRGRGEGAAR